MFVAASSRPSIADEATVLVASRRVPLSEADFWEMYDQMEARLTAPLTNRMLDLADVRAGTRVLDLATGRGEPAIPAAHRVAPNGYVLGVDTSRSMLAMARARADREGVTNIELKPLDAAVPDGFPQASFDVALVRWGLMYMHAPVDALANARRAMTPGGVLVAATLAEPERCSYYELPRRILAKYRAVPPSDPACPGPFRYANVEHLRADLKAAGLRVEHVEEVVVPVVEAQTTADVVAWVKLLGLGELLDGMPPSARDAWDVEFSDALAATRSDGVVRLGSTSHIVVASAR